MGANLQQAAPAATGNGRASAALRRGLRHLIRRSPYDIFESIVVFAVTLSIMGLVAKGLWHLLNDVWFEILSRQTTAADQALFQNVFGLVFTLLIALEFKRSILVGRSNRDVINIRPIILIAMLATVRRTIMADLGHVDVAEALTTSAAILSLGVVYWLVNKAGDPGQSGQP